jgi:hypothetical protein
LLDFPFLYQRFVDLHAPWVGRAGIALQGQLLAALFYGFETRGWLFQLEELDSGGAALESTLRLGYDVSESWRVLAGFKTSLARYPIGLRLHWLPLVDVQHAF